MISLIGVRIINFCFNFVSFFFFKDASRLQNGQFLITDMGEITQLFPIGVNGVGWVFTTKDIGDLGREIYFSCGIVCVCHTFYRSVL